jgi:hypothetical protein
MSQLIQIADFQFIALKDGIDITDEDRKKFTSMSLKDEYFSPRVVEVPTSLALLAELEKCPFANSDFRNDLEEETPQITKTDDFVYIAPAYSVKSTKIPLLLQKAGLKIKRKQFVAYLARIGNQDEPYMLVNRDGTPFEAPEKNSDGRAYKLNIDVYDDILALRPEEYEKYLHVKKDIDEGRFAEVNKQDLYLWALTDTFITRREKLDVVFHEIKHAQNSLIFFDYLFNNPNCKLSGIDILKYGQDDELSAKLAEAIEAINAYNQSGNKSDLSAFESSYILQQLLHNKSIDERKKLLSNMPYVVREVCMYWYKNYATGYKPQFVQNTLIKLDQIPLKYLTYESDGTAYKDIRKSMFTYNVYDARTGKYINMDLSEYVIDIGIIESDLKMTQQMYQDKVFKRQQFLDLRADKIQHDLITEAHEKYIKLVKETEYRKALIDLQNNGMDYMSALNFIPEVTDTKDKGLDKSVEVHESPKHQIAEHKTKKDSKQTFYTFKKAIHKIKEIFLSRQFRETGSDGRDYE